MRPARRAGAAPAAALRAAALGTGGPPGPGGLAGHDGPHPPGWGEVANAHVRRLHAVIDALLSDKTKLQAMGVASRERALAEFDYDVLTARLAAVLGVKA